MNIRLFLKGVLLYATFLCFLIAIMGIESLCDKGYLIETVLIILGLIYYCKRVISSKELDSLL